MVFTLLPCEDMPTSFRRSLPITGVAVMMTAALAMAQTSATSAPRVRPETAQTEALLRDLLARSVTARALVAALQSSDVTVYIRHRTFTGMLQDGRIGLVRSESPTRLLIAEIGCPRPWFDQLVTLGHELQHAVEIAAARHVGDPRTLADYFGAIGFKTRGVADASFETSGAQEMATRIRQELLGKTVRTSHDRH